MKLTHASSYALHAVAHLAREKGGGPVASHLIAAAHGLPERFLLKVLKPLVSARLLDSVKGPHGGYSLRGGLDGLTMLDVIEAVDGPIRSDNPFTAEGAATLDARLERACCSATEALREQLKAVRISDLVGRADRRKTGK